MIAENLHMSHHNQCHHFNANIQLNPLFTQNNVKTTMRKIKWIRPPLCTYRLNWARRTSWGWWDDWDDTVLRTQNSKFLLCPEDSVISKFEPWRSEAEHATSRSRRLPTILTFTRWWGRNIFVSFKPPRPGTEPRTLAWKAAVLTTTLGPPPTTMRDNLGILSLYVAIRSLHWI